MIFWIDAHLSPALAPWLTKTFGVEAYSVKFLGYRDATDRVIFEAARKALAVIITKNADFVSILEWGTTTSYLANIRQYKQCTPEVCVERNV